MHISNISNTAGLGGRSSCYPAPQHHDNCGPGDVVLIMHSSLNRETALSSDYGLALSLMSALCPDLIHSTMHIASVISVILLTLEADPFAVLRSASHTPVRPQPCDTPFEADLLIVALLANAVPT